MEKTVIHKLKRLALLLLVMGPAACTRPANAPSPKATQYTVVSTPTTVPHTATAMPTTLPTLIPTPTPTETPRDAVVVQLLPSAPAPPPPANWTPDRPLAFDAEKDTQESWVREYIQLVTAMLNASGNVDTVLEQLVAWMPADSAFEGPRPPNAWAIVRDLNNDGEEEWLISVPARDQGCWVTYCPGYLLILYKRDDLFMPASIIITDELVWEVSLPTLLMVDDINADGRVEVVVEQDGCGAHTCFTSLLIGQWDGQRWHDLTADPVTQAYTDYTIADNDNDGVLEVVMHGGMYGSVGAGLQRPHTLLFDWRDSAYRLVEDTPDPDTHPYYQMLDANSALARGDVTSALTLTLAVTNYPGIYEDDMGWLTTEAWARIVGYATIEAMLGYAQQGDVEAMRQVHSSLLARAYTAPDNPYPDAAGYALEVYEATGDALAACLAVEDFIVVRAEVASFFEWYGYGTERLTVDRICPLDHAAEKGSEL